MARLVAAVLAAFFVGAVAAPAGADTVEADARAMLLVGIAGTQLDGATAEHLEAGGRGLLLFSRNVASRAQVRALTAAAACAAGAPLLVAVDQEPGPVARLTRIGIESPARHLDPDAMTAAAWKMARQMAALGVNMNLAPVVDVADPAVGALTGRVLDGDPAVVATRGSAFVAGHRAARVAAVPKHFPGHGRAVADPHRQVATIDASSLALALVDRVPFAAAFAEGARAVMVGHPVYTALDAEQPASLSPAIIDLLRRRFGFDGVAVTDGLGMAGVRQGRSVADAAVAAARAGEDLLIVESSSSIEPVVAAIVAAVAESELTRGRVAEAAGRVRALAAWAAPVGCRVDRAGLVRH